MPAFSPGVSSASNTFSIACKRSMVFLNTAALQAPKPACAARFPDAAPVSPAFRLRLWLPPEDGKACLGQSPDSDRDHFPGIHQVDPIAPASHASVPARYSKETPPDNKDLSPAFAIRGNPRVVPCPGRRDMRADRR